MQSPAFPSFPLVGVDVIEEDLIESVSRQKAAKVKHSQRAKTPKPEVS